MEEGRLDKNIDIEKYMPKIIETKIREAIEKLCANKCADMEILLERHDDFHL